MHRRKLPAGPTSDNRTKVGLKARKKLEALPCFSNHYFWVYVKGRNAQSSEQVPEGVAKLLVVPFVIVVTSSGQNFHWLGALRLQNSVGSPSS